MLFDAIAYLCGQEPGSKLSHKHNHLKSYLNFEAMQTKVPPHITAEAGHVCFPVFDIYANSFILWMSQSVASTDREC